MEKGEKTKIKSLAEFEKRFGKITHHAKLKSTFFIFTKAATYITSKRGWIKLTWGLRGRK